MSNFTQKQLEDLDKKSKAAIREIGSMPTPPPQPSETSETDAEEVQYQQYPERPDTMVVHADFARSLEKRLREAERDKLMLSNAIKEQLETIKDLEHWRKHAEESDKEFLRLEDWLIGNQEFNKDGTFINRTEKCRERIRDLIAAEAHDKAMSSCAEKLAEELKIELCHEHGMYPSEALADFAKLKQSK